MIAPAIPPERRSFPNRPLILVLSFAVGLFLGVAWALVLETLSQAHASGRKSALAAPGGWPAPTGPAPAEGLRARLPSGSKRSLFGRSKAPAAPVTANAVLTQPDSDYAREIRRFAEDLVASFDPGTTTTLLITGVRPGESQPILTVNLALALSQIGANVLLIDGTGRPNGVKAHVPAIAPAFRSISMASRTSSRRFRRRASVSCSTCPMAGFPFSAAQRAAPKGVPARSC